MKKRAQINIKMSMKRRKWAEKIIEQADFEGFTDFFWSKIREMNKDYHIKMDDSIDQEERL